MLAALQYTESEGLSSSKMTKKKEPQVFQTQVEHKSRPCDSSATV